MEENKGVIGKNMLWNSTGTLFYLGCQWLLTVLVVRLSSNYSDAGILALAMSIATPLSTIAMLNLRTFQVANMETRFSDGDFLYVRAITSIVSFIICIAIVVLSGYNLYTLVCVLLFMFFRLSEAAADVLHGIDQQAWRLDIAGKSFLLRGAVTLAGFMIGEYVFHSLSVSIVLMGAGAYAIVILYDFPFCKKCADPDFSMHRANLFPLIKIGAPLGGFSFLLTLLSSIPRFFLERWHGEDTLGIFASIATITVLIPQLANFIFNPLIPLFAERWKTGDVKGFKKLFSLCSIVILLIGGAAVFAGILLGEWSLTLIFGESIRPYIWLFPPTIGNAILTAYIWLLGSVLTVFGDYNALAFMSLVSVAGCCLTSIVFIRENAFMGTISATIAGLLIECILLAVRTLILMEKRRNLGKGVND